MKSGRNSVRIHDLVLVLKAGQQRVVNPAGIEFPDGFELIIEEAIGIVLPTQLPAGQVVPI